MAHFDHDMNKVVLAAPVDVLMSGFGVTVAQKTVVTGAAGAQGTWILNKLAPYSGTNPPQIRSFANYTDSVTHEEMAFAGGGANGIFSGGYNQATGRVQWGASAEAGSNPACWKPGPHTCRTMSFAFCSGKLYATYYDSIMVRTDGANPSWTTIYKYPGSYPNPQASGYRGLSCVLNLYGSGFMLLAALEGGNIYSIQLDGSNPRTDLYTSNFISSQLGVRAGEYTIGAYNNMPEYPPAFTSTTGALLVGEGLVYVPINYSGAWNQYLRYGSLMVRYSNGAYAAYQEANANLAQTPWPIATRAIAVSQFPGDPPGTIYTGGYDAHFQPAHNSDWVYRGVLE
jgi:hypothetical protein